MSLKSRGRKETKILFELYQTIGVDVINVTARELSDNVDRFIGITKGSSIPFISANIVYKDSGNNIFPSYAIVNIREKAIGIIGITKPVFSTWENTEKQKIIIRDPANVLPALLKSLKGKTDTIILLAFYPKRHLGKLLQGMDGIDMVIGADGYYTSSETEEIVGIPVCYAGRQGQAVGIVQFDFKSGKFVVREQRVIHLTTDLPEDKTIKESIDKKILELE